MRDRGKSLERILSVQRQVVRLADWRLAELNKQCAEIKQDQERLHAFVTGEEALSPLLSAAAYKRGQALLSSATAREREAALQSDHADTMRRRERLAEKLVDKSRAAQAQETEKKLLQETVEAFAQRDDASFP